MIEINFFMTLACYTLAIFLIYDRVEAYLAIWTPLPDEEKTTKEETIEEVVEEVIENLEEVIEDELRADKELERKHRAIRIRKRLLPADKPS